MMKRLFRLIYGSVRQGCLYVMSRPLFLVSIVAIPLVSAFLMLNLMSIQHTFESDIESRMNHPFL